MAQSRKENHVAVIEAVLRGENRTGHSDRAVIMAHVREMQRTINELTEKLNTVQFDLFERKGI